MLSPIRSRISVRIPTINSYPTLVRALDSVLAQDVAPMDILIVDNCSMDGSWPQTKELSKRDPRVKVEQNANRGLAENWNRCVETAVADYLLLLHTDDELLPGMIRETIEFLDRHPSVGFVHTDGYDRFPDGKETVRRTQGVPILKAGVEALTKVLVEPNLLCSSIVVRRICHERLGLYLDGCLSPEWEMWARIGRDYDIGHIAKPLVRCYAHTDDYSGSSPWSRPLSVARVSQVESQWIDEGEKIVSYFPEDHRQTVRTTMQMTVAGGLWSGGSLAWQNGKWRRGQEFFMRAYSFLPRRMWWQRYIKELGYAILRRVKCLMRGTDIQY